MKQIDVDRYSREGILFPVPALSDEEVTSFRARVEEVERRLGGQAKPHELPQPHLFHRWAYDLVVHPAVLDVVEQVIGPNILVHSVTLFSKHPRTTEYVAWHQDGHNWGLDAPRLTTAWIALTDSTPENGCMRVVPGSHGDNWLPHVKRPLAKDSFLAGGLEIAVDVDESDAVDVTLSAGQISLHHVNLIHGSNANTSNGKRIGIGARYVAPEVQQSRDHHEVVLARGRDDHGHYSILREPPSGDLDESLRAQDRFTRRLMAGLRAAGGDNGTM